MQLDRLEDNGMAVLLLYPKGRQSCDVPREVLPEDARAGDVFEASFAHDREETGRLAPESKRLLGDLLGRNGG